MSKKKDPQKNIIPSHSDAGPGLPIPPEKSFPIVGIGASAGGLAAFEAFFSAMPSDIEPNMAFVLVQHLAPDHKSILTDLVKNYTRMKVFEVADGIDVQINCAYIIPPNRDMAFLNGKLHLLEPGAPRGLRLPIDFFFLSLAQDQHERAICIVLSGTGSDGSMGIRAVKSAGGMVMVQEPDFTEYDGMPRSAIATGLVDYILPPAEMPAQLIAYASHAFGKPTCITSSPAVQEEDFLKKIFILLRNQTGHDFSLYKQNTIVRRVERRMAVNQIDNIDSYVRYLQHNSEEIDALFNDMLIGVTSFFRDKEAFAALNDQVIPRLFANRPAETPVRIWVPGCSTGEEAYSFAILIQEHLESLRKFFNVQVFATDIDSKAIETARAGVYPASIAADVSQERLARFFVFDQDSGTYRIQKGIRDMLVFSEQNVIKDPPFSKLDLVSCRNLLIYMSGGLQKKLIPLFHYSLNPNGILFLGTSETIGEFTELFAIVDHKWKLYNRKELTTGAAHPTFGKLLPPLAEGGVLRTNKVDRVDTKISMRDLAQQELLRVYAPASALVNARGEVLFIYGRTGKYLEPAPGESNLNIIHMAREGLRRELSTALHKAINQKSPVHYPGLKVKTNGDFTTVNLTVRPVTAGYAEIAAAGLYLVIFEDAPPIDEISSIKPALVDAATTESSAKIEELEFELRAKEEYLQSTLEEMETSNEELKSTNEELQSVNEELQSTNEELETSKEELQSVNEELATVNNELQVKVADLSQANNDMNNLLAGTGVGTIFVDHQQHIQRFTPAVKEIINLIKTDMGRPIGDIHSNLVDYNSLVMNIQSVLDTLIPKEIEVQTEKGVWYLLRILPYRTLENVIEGVVLTFTEFTEIKKARDILREDENLRRLAVVVRDANDAIIVYDLKGRILTWNPGAERMYGWTEAEALNMNNRDLVPAELHKKTEEIIQELSQLKLLDPYRTCRLTKDGRTIDIMSTTTALVTKTGEAYAVTTTEREIKTGDGRHG